MKPIKLSIKLLMISAVAAAAFVAYFVWQWQKRESVDAHYRATLSLLLQPRKDGAPDSAPPATLLKQLNEVIELKANGHETERQKLRGEATHGFIELFKSQSFDLGQGSNVELETTVLANWKEYAAFLSEHPQDNVWIMYKYFLTLQNIGQKEATIIQSAAQQADGSITYKGEAKDRTAPALLQKLNAGYRLHADLLKAQPAEVNKKYLLNSFCWYRKAISNLSMVEYVFSYDETQVKAEELRCMKDGQLMESPN